MPVAADRTALATVGGETMGTRWQATVVASPRTSLHLLHAALQAELDRVDAQMSTWRPDSTITRYNEAAAGTWHMLPPDMHEVLETALDIARASGGAYDPTVGPVVAAWGFGAASRTGGHGSLPDASRLSAAHSMTGWRRLALGNGPACALQPGGLQLDLSAIAKGYAVDLLVAAARRAGVDAALVEVGGEVRGFGRKPDGAAWRVLVEASADEGLADAPPCVLQLEDMAVATSGDRWHARDTEGVRVAHTIDPRTGLPVRSVATSVSVVAATAMHADAWATAMTVLGPDAGIALATSLRLDVRFVQHAADGLRETMTPGFAARLAR